MHAETVTLNAARADRLFHPTSFEWKGLQETDPRSGEAGQALPIRIPVRNTSTPPSTTWSTADTSGVSM